jgi:hypothetical protein
VAPARSTSGRYGVQSLDCLSWRKSSYSGGVTDKTNCIEVATCGRSTVVRDSKTLDARALFVPVTAWNWFVRHLPNES